MRLMLMTFMLCTSIPAADSGRPTEPEAMNALRMRQKAPKSKRTFYPLRLLRRLGNAESEFAFRLSSWGIHADVEAGNSVALPRPTLLTEASTSTPQGLLGAASR